MKSVVPRPDLSDGDVEPLLDVAANIASIVPLVGSVVSNTLSGMSASRRMARVHDTLEQFASLLEQHQEAIDERLVGREEFEELLWKTLNLAANEHDAEKRKLYAQVLVGALKVKDQPQYERIRFLRVLDEISMNHVALLQALLAEPRAGRTDSGSAGGTLRTRLPELSESESRAIVDHLNGLQVVKMTETDLARMMSPQGAEDLRPFVTPFGRRLVGFLEGGGR